MSKLHLIILTSITTLILSACSQILEPVYFAGQTASSTTNNQEEFNINIKPLTFSNAQYANKASYPRKLMRTGSGSQANVYNEIQFLNSKLPSSTNNFDYTIGIGDVLSFVQLNSFVNLDIVWPSPTPSTEYLLGPGDKLAFIQENDVSNNSKVISTIKNLEQDSDNNGVILSTSGIIGTDGKILLFGLGNITVADRSLSEVRAEVRNILIRNGLAPNFQLEITEYHSKKAYLTVQDGKSLVIPINNLSLTLRQLLLSKGISKNAGNHVLVTLTRESQIFRFTAEQLLEPSAPDINIRDNDQIEIQSVNAGSIAIKSVVGSQGNILLAGIGSFKADGRKLKKLQIEVSQKLAAEGLKPDFQLEVIEFNSQKAYLVQIDGPSKIIPLTNKKITLRDLILGSGTPTTSITGLLKFTLRRSGKEFHLTGEQVMDPKTKDIWIQNMDHIEVESFTYKPGQVFALGGMDSAQIIPIDPSKRETLADVLFVPNGALSNSLAQRSEVYLVRGRSPSYAYHLDAQNVSRLLVAAQMELRPNDIIFVAERPIISFSRTLAEINPLRLLMRDLETGNFP